MLTGVPCRALWKFLVHWKNSSSPSMTTHSASMPNSFMRGTSLSKISATPPPLRVELMWTTFKPLSKEASWRRCSTTSLPATCP